MAIQTASLLKCKYHKQKDPNDNQLISKQNTKTVEKEVTLNEKNFTITLSLLLALLIITVVIC